MILEFPAPPHLRLVARNASRERAPRGSDWLAGYAQAALVRRIEEALRRAERAVARLRAQLECVRAAMPLADSAVVQALGELDSASREAREAMQALPTVSR